MRAPHWLSKCMCDGKKRPLPILVNALIALRNDDGTRDAIAFDEMLRVPMLLHQIGQPLDGDLREPRPLTDKDVTDLQEWMQLAGLTQISHDNVRLAVESHARDHAYHPVLDYLESLRWDDTARLNTWLTDYLGVEHNNTLLVRETSRQGERIDRATLYVRLNPDGPTKIRFASGVVSVTVDDEQVAIVRWLGP